MLPTSWLRRSYVLVILVSPTRGRWLSAEVRLARNGRGAPAPLSTEDLTAIGSAQHGDLLAVDQREVDVGPEAGRVHRVHEPLAVHLDVLRETVLLRGGREQHLEELAVLDRHDHVQ